MLTLVEAQTPTPTEGTLLVEIIAAGVNYADVMARSGFYPSVPKAPFPVGFEIAGVAAGGGLGNLAVQLAKTRAAKVVGLNSKSKFELVRSLGGSSLAFDQVAVMRFRLGHLGDAREEHHPPWFQS